MRLTGSSFLVTGGASGLGLATVRRLVDAGAHVTILDLASSDGAAVADALGEAVRFAPADVRDPDAVTAALDLAESAGPLRGTVHCAGRGGPVRVVEKDGSPGSLDTYQDIVSINLVGSFNVLRLSAARMAAHEPVDEDGRGVVIMTASIAAWEGQISQAPYASSKAGIVGLTLVAARDLAARAIRVNTIAPGVFDTPILSRFSDEIKDGLAKGIPHPRRLGQPEDFAALACHIIENPYLNGETIRLDGALRMQPK